MDTLRACAALVLSAACLVAPAVPAATAESGPGGTLVFTSVDADFTNLEIGSVHADGTHQRLLTHSEGFDVSAAWSPDGRRIAFTSARSMPPGFTGEQRYYSEMYVMNGDGSHVRRITFNQGVTDYQPAWSPDGRRIVVTRAAGTPAPPGHSTQPSDLVIIDLATGHERALTHSPSTWETTPHWSPDGKRIAFDGDLSEPGNNDIYTINVNGTGLVRVTHGPAYDADVRYSPDGRQLAFDSDRNGGYADAFLMRADGSRVRQLTTDHASYQPSFSPDGRFLAFTRDNADGYSDIFRMRVDGTDQRNLTRTPTTYEFDQDWQPS